jgi:hypothetical protein
VRRASQTDRRREERFPQSLELTVQPLPELGSRGKLRVVALHGRLQNISRGGICLMTSRPIKRFSVLRCDINLGDAPIQVPTLMQVRWTRKQDKLPDSFLSGLKFLF